MHVFAPDQSPAQKARRLVVELIADFLSNKAPGLRRSPHFSRFDDLLDDLQIARPARFIFAALPRSILARCGVGLLQRGGASTFPNSFSSPSNNSNCPASSFSLLAPKIRRTNKSIFCRSSVFSSCAFSRAFRRTTTCSWLSSNFRSSSASRVLIGGTDEP